MCAYFRKLTSVPRERTSVITFSAVSVPRLRSVPGTLLLIVAGMITIGILNAAYLSRASASCNRLWYPFKKNDKVINEGPGGKRA